MNILNNFRDWVAESLIQTGFAIASPRYLEKMMGLPQEK